MGAGQLPELRLRRRRLLGEGRTVFGQSTSGEKLPSSLHNTDHSAYNDAVRKEPVGWARANQIDLSRMTADEATRFVSHVRSGSNNAVIRSFVGKISDYNRT